MRTSSSFDEFFMGETRKLLDERGREKRLDELAYLFTFGEFGTRGPTYKVI